MSCNLHKAWLEAELAMKNAFQVAFEHEGKVPANYETDYRADITDFWHMYQNVVRMRKNLVQVVPENYQHEPTESEKDSIVITGADDGVITLPDGCYDPDGNISIDTSNITLGDAIASVPDAISWNNEVFTSPEITFGTDTQVAPPQASQSGELPPTTPEKSD